MHIPTSVPLFLTSSQPQQRNRHRQPAQTRQRRIILALLQRIDHAPSPVQPHPPLLPILLALAHAVPHQHPVGLPVLDGLEQLRVGVRVHKLVAQRLEGADLEPQVPQLRFVAEDVVFEVADFFFEIEDARGGALGAVD